MLYPIIPATCVLNPPPSRYGSLLEQVLAGRRHGIGIGFLLTMYERFDLTLVLLIFVRR